MNVRDSDATLILNCGELSGGTAYTLKVADAMEKPVLVLDLDHEADLEMVTAWLRRHGIRKLNIAGPREDKCPGIYARARRFLHRLFAHC